MHDVGSGRGGYPNTDNKIWKALLPDRERRGRYGGNSGGAEEEVVVIG